MSRYLSVLVVVPLLVQACLDCMAAWRHTATVLSQRAWKANLPRAAFAAPSCARQAAWRGCSSVRVSPVRLRFRRKPAFATEVVACSGRALLLGHAAFCEIVAWSFRSAAASGCSLSDPAFGIDVGSGRRKTFKDKNYSERHAELRDSGGVARLSCVRCFEDAVPEDSAATVVLGPLAIEDQEPEADEKDDSLADTAPEAHSGRVRITGKTAQPAKAVVPSGTGIAGAKGRLPEPPQAQKRQVAYDEGQVVPPPPPKRAKKL